MRWPGARCTGGSCRQQASAASRVPQLDSNKGVKQPSGQEGMGKVGDKGVMRGGWRAVTGPELEHQPGPPASFISSRTVGRVGT